MAGTEYCYSRDVYEAVRYTGENAEAVSAFTGGKFEACEDGLYIEKGIPDVRTMRVKLQPGTWIIKVPWSPVLYQYVSDEVMQDAFRFIDVTICSTKRWNQGALPVD